MVQFTWAVVLLCAGLGSARPGTSHSHSYHWTPSHHEHHPGRTQHSHSYAPTASFRGPHGHVSSLEEASVQTSSKMEASTDAGFDRTQSWTSSAARTIATLTEHRTSTSTVSILTKPAKATAVSNDGLEDLLPVSKILKTIAPWSNLLTYEHQPATFDIPKSVYSSTPRISASKPTRTVGSLAAPSSSASSVVAPMPSNQTSSDFCKRVPIDDCNACEGQPSDDPDAFCGLTAETNWYETWPKTCMRVVCAMTMENVTISPDGVPRLSSTYNGQMPGPYIEAFWGDEMEFTLTNNLQSNGTSTHFHGLRQLNTNIMDGVPSIVQCPLAGEQSQTYRFNLTQYGTTWYHSHYSLQSWEGAFGPMTIHGPSHVSYDIDLGPVVVQDWLHDTVFSLFDEVQRTGDPVQDNVLINGKNIFTDPKTNHTTGSRAEFRLTPGKKHRLRLVSGAMDSYFAFSIDGHELTVIANDLVPIQPWTTNILNIAIGQRYDVIVEAKEIPGNYWMRFDALSASVDPGHVPPCGAPNLMGSNTRAIVHYDGFEGLPGNTSIAYKHDNECTMVPLDNTVPYLALDAKAPSSKVAEEVHLAENASGIYRWVLNEEPFQTEFDQPTLLDIYENSTDYKNALAIDVPDEKQWVYVMIESGMPVPHPIHLHGHDFYVLAAGQGFYDVTTPLNLKNPARRDVQLMPGRGYLVLAFYTDNPGVWLMHCHIGWHVSMGFALQFIESSQQIKTVLDKGPGEQLAQQCDDYRAFAGKAKIVEEDSGV